MSRHQARLFGLIVSIAVVAFLCVVPHMFSATDTTLWAQALYLGIAAMGLNLLTGYNGQVSLGHGAFFGIGAYTTALLMHAQGWQFLPTLPVSAAVCVAVGVLIGVPALRVKGLYLALVTLGLAVLFPDITKHYVHQTGGTNLVSLFRGELAPPAWVPTWLSEIGRDDQWAYYVTLVCAVVLVALAYGLIRFRFGRALIAVRDHEPAAETVGINAAFTKVSVFAISALYAGIAGSCSVLVDHLANADKVQTFQLSITFLVAIVIGGTATVVGPLLGAGLVVYVQWFISDVLPRHTGETGFLHRTVGNRAAAPAVFGILLILFVFVLPDGLVGGSRRLWARLTRGRRRSTPPPTPAPLTT
jgi:branched-chain amino acid transport system permease protein